MLLHRVHHSLQTVAKPESGAAIAPPTPDKEHPTYDFGETGSTKTANIRKDFSRL
jgi:hypothetical protein